ncbi:unnamed protein product [Lota lota]
MSIMQIQLVQQETPIMKERHPIIQCVISNEPDELKLAIAQTIASYILDSNKLSNMIHRLASNGVQICSEIKYFIDLDIAVRCKRPEEVFQLFDRVMLHKNPQTHVSVLDIMLSVTWHGEAEYHSKAIQWLMGKPKINLYIVKHFSNPSKEWQALVVYNRHYDFCTLTEIPNNVSLALIPKLQLPTKMSPNIEEIIVVKCYEIIQKTKVKDDWNLDIIGKLGIFAHRANTIVISIGSSSVPGEILIDMRMDDNLQPGITTFTKKCKWLQRSNRWREKLDKLSKTQDIIKVGSIFLVNNEEFRIAKGSNGTEVFLGLREDGTEVAVKRMSRTNYNVLKNEESFLRLPELDHKNIIRYVDSAEDDTFVYLALQLCEFTLEEFLKEELTEKQKINLVKEVLSSLSVLHSQTPQIIHRAITPQNILIDVCRKARLADFGISRRLPNGQTTLHTRGAGTKCWMARETLDEDVDVPCKMSSDIQVAGMLTYYILSGGHHPFGKGCRCESNILDGVYNLEHVQDVITEDLVEWMINKNPKERPTVKQCLAHPFFWSRLRKIEYLKSIGNEEEVRNYRATDKCLLDELDGDVGEASWKNWKQKFPPELVRKMDPKGKYSENTAGLLRFIRNLLEHCPKEEEHIDLMATFPDLFGRVYVFAKKKGWNSRVSLKRMFQEEDDITSGHAMNTLNLEDQAAGFSVPVQELGELVEPYM